MYPRSRSWGGRFPSAACPLRRRFPSCSGPSQSCYSEFSRVLSLSTRLRRSCPRKLAQRGRTSCFRDRGLSEEPLCRPFVWLRYRASDSLLCTGYKVGRLASLCNGKGGGFRDDTGRLGRADPRQTEPDFSESKMGGLAVRVDPSWHAAHRQSSNLFWHLQSPSALHGL